MHTPTHASQQGLQSFDRNLACIECVLYRGQECVLYSMCLVYSVFCIDVESQDDHVLVENTLRCMLNMQWGYPHDAYTYRICSV